MSESNHTGRLSGAIGRPCHRRLEERTVAFNPLADNAAQTLAKGMTVMVAGYLADNSYTDPATGQTIRRTRLEAGDIAVSLRFASIRTAGRSPRCRLRCRTCS